MKQKQQSQKSARGNVSKLPRVYTLKEAAEALGSKGVSVKSLRREVYAGRIKALRVRPGITAKLLITEDELLRWLEEDAAARQYMTREVSNG